MISVMSIKRAAAIWSISERRVNELCKTGRIRGAYKENGRWYIPSTAAKPFDMRYHRTPPIKTLNHKLPLPVGISDFRKVAKHYYFVDKSLLIKEILDERTQVSVFTRPRSFGKSLDLDMLRTFFELPGKDEDTTKYFKSLKIWSAGEEYRSHLGRYPVIGLNLKSVAGEDLKSALRAFRRVLSEEFARHRYLADSEACSSIDRDSFQRIMEGFADRGELEHALSLITRMLDEHHGSAPVIIIDEYDAPMVSAYKNKYYDEMTEFLRCVMTDGMDENRHLSFAFLAGVLCLSGDSIFRGLNNIKFNTVLDRRYDQYFGFTRDEVQEMLRYYNVSEKTGEISSWYFGYHFGEAEVYNPWSVINYFDEGYRALPYWETTGDNTIIDDFLMGASLEMLEKLELMLQGKSFSSRIDISVISPHTDDDASVVYSYMLATGYLKAVRSDQQFDGDFMCELTIPNRELAYLYGKKILDRFSGVIPRASATAFREALYRADAEQLRGHVYRLIVQTSNFNTGEADTIFYHGLVLGLCALLGSRYHVVSEREDNGNFSIEMMPLEIRLPGILIMTKATHRGTDEQLEALARFARKQITNRQYETDTKMRYVERALKFGVAYSSEAVKIVED